MEREVGILDRNLSNLFHCSLLPIDNKAQPGY